VLLKSGKLDGCVAIDFQRTTGAHHFSWLQVQPALVRRGRERTGRPLLDSRTNGGHFGRSSAYCQENKIHGTLLVRTAEEGFATCFIAGSNY
jgi:hypothetical protein